MNNLTFHTFPHFVGFDRLWNDLDLATRFPDEIKWPPYNVRKEGEDEFTIELAVAGFGKEDVQIELKEGVLTVKGEKETSQGTFLHQGIAGRKFIRKFNLADTIKVSGADLNNGILTIYLENEIPEHRKPRAIPIGNAKARKAQLLTEEKKK